MQTHSAFKHFRCERCNKSFALKSYLNKHYESSCFKDASNSNSSSSSNNSKQQEQQMNGNENNCETLENDHCSPISLTSSSTFLTSSKLNNDNKPTTANQMNSNEQQQEPEKHHQQQRPSYTTTTNPQTNSITITRSKVLQQNGGSINIKRKSSTTE